MVAAASPAAATPVSVAAAAVAGCWLLLADWRYPDNQDQHCLKELDALQQEVV